MMRPDSSSPAFARSRQCSAAKRHVAKWPFRCPLITESKVASSILKLKAPGVIPALLTRMSRQPQSAAGRVRRTSPGVPVRWRQYESLTREDEVRVVRTEGGRVGGDHALPVGDELAGSRVATTAGQRPLGDDPEIVARAHHDGVRRGRIAD